MDELTYAVVGTVDKSTLEDGVLTFAASKATGPELDLSGQRVDMEWATEAMSKWFATGANLREQHDPHRAIGKALTLENRNDGVYISGKVVDPLAIQKVQHGILRQLSIGVRNALVDFTDKAAAPNGRIRGGDIIEVTLCDRGANPTTDLVLAKAAEADGSFVAVEEIRELEKAESVQHSHSHMHGDEGHHRHQHTHGPDVAEHRSLDSGVRHSHGHSEEQADSLVPDDEEKTLVADLTKARLSTQDRKDLPSSDFVFPDKAPGSGSYPIPDEAHARDALARASGKPEEAEVKRAVHRKFPDIEIGDEKAAEPDRLAVLEAQVAELLKAAKGDMKPNAECPDPDDDGDDDRTPEGDTDHDYWNEDGTPTAKGKAAGFTAKEGKKDLEDAKDKVDVPELVKTLSADPESAEALRKALGVQAESALLKEIDGLKASLEKAQNVQGVTRIRPPQAERVSSEVDRLRYQRGQYVAIAESITDATVQKSYRDLAQKTQEQIDKLLA